MEGRKISVNDTANDPSPVLDGQGRKLILGKQIGCGAEGVVYDLLSTDQFVVKIYHKPLDAATLKKLDTLIRDHNENLTKISAWPVSLIRRAETGEICGYLMQRISDYGPIHILYAPSSSKLIPKSDWKFLIHAAKNLAAAFSVISKYGYIMEDPNEGNIFINNQACVKLLDCSSFGIQSRKRGLFYCKLRVDQMIFLGATFAVLLISKVVSINMCFKLFRLVNKILY